jgi:hypothetical protein
MDDRRRRAGTAASAVALALGAAFPAADAANAFVPAQWKNCTAVHKRYPHGVGRVFARDKTSGTPVTNFRRSNLLYRTSMRWNSRLDADKDGIACEKL